MQCRGRTALTGALVAAVVCLASCVASCVPPPPMGYIAPGPQKPGRVMVGAQGGGGIATGNRMTAGGALQLEAFGTARTSFAMTAVGGSGGSAAGRGFGEWGGFEDDTEYRLTGYGQLRLGLRHRLSGGYFLGGGFTGHVRWVHSVSSDWDTGEELSSRELDGGFSADFEWGYGKRWRRIGLFGQRLFWHATSVTVLDLYQELTLAWFPKGNHFALTMHLGLGFTLPYLPWGSASVGFVVLI